MAQPTASLLAVASLFLTTIPTSSPITLSPSFGRIRPIAIASIFLNFSITVANPSRPAIRARRALPLAILHSLPSDSGLPSAPSLIVLVRTPRPAPLVKIVISMKVVTWKAGARGPTRRAGIRGDPEISSPGWERSLVRALGSGGSHSSTDPIRAPSSFFGKIPTGPRSRRCHRPVPRTDGEPRGGVSWKRRWLLGRGWLIVALAGRSFPGTGRLFFWHLPLSTFEAHRSPSVGPHPFQRLIPNRRRRHRRCSRTPAPRRHQCDRQFAEIDDGRGRCRWRPGYPATQAGPLLGKADNICSLCDLTVLNPTRTSGTEA